MKPKHLSLRALCVLLALSVAASTLLSGCAAASAEEPAQPAAAQVRAEPEKEKPENLIGTKKSETVYVNLDPTGRPYDTVVTDWLHSDTPGVTFEDVSDLKDIENIKGDRGPRQEGERLSWQLDGTDLYYTGRTGKELPLEVKITYRLDGKEYDPQELAGKSGRLEIRLSFKNTSKHEVEIGGEKTVMYTPLMVAAGMALPDDTFGNVKVSDGSVVTDGSSQVVAMVCLPGLGDSLALDSYSVQELNDLDFPEEFTVTADVVDFEMGPIMIAASPELPDLDDLKKSDEFDDMEQDLYDLRDMQNDLETLDPDRDIRSLLTDPERTDAARLIIDDVFDFYDLNKDILDILPKYVTDENVRLYDRIDHDLSEKAMGTLLDDDDLADLFDLVDDLSPNRLQELVDDYDELQKNKALKAQLDQIIAQADQGGLQTLLDDLKTVYAGVKTAQASDPEGYREGLQALQQFLEICRQMKAQLEAQQTRLQARQVVMGYINNPDAAGKLDDVLSGSKLNPTLRDELVRASANGDIVDPGHIRPIRREGDKKAEPVTSEPTVNEPATDEPTTSEPATGEPTTGEPTTSEPTTSEPTASEPTTSEPTASGPVVSEPEGVTAVLAEYIESSGGEDAGAAGKGEEPPAEEKKDPPADADGSSGEGGEGGGDADPAPALDGGSKADGAEKKPVDEDRMDVYAEITGTTAGYYLLTGAIDEYLNKAGDDELKEIVESAPRARSARSGGTVPVPTEQYQQLMAMKGMVEQMEKLVVAIGPDELLKLLDDVNRYGPGLEQMAGQLQGTEVQKYLDRMLGHLKENTDNMETLVLLLKKLDETNLLDEVENIDDLRDDLTDARPIIKALRRDLKRTDIHKSLHESPETITTLLRMRDDLDAHRDITETMRNMLQDEKISLSRGMIATLDRLKDKGAADSAIEKLDDLDELLERKDRYVDLSKEYGVFTAAPEGLDTDVKFVMKTDEVKIPEPAEETAAPVEEKQGFFGWLKGLFT